MPVRFVGGDIPEKIPPEFSDLVSLGQKQVEVELFGWKFTFSTLVVWENRAIAKSTVNYDMFTRNTVSKTDILVQSIVSATLLSTQQTFDFSTTDNKGLLRSIILSLDEHIQEAMWDAYSILVEFADKDFSEKYPKLRDRILKDITGFFVPAGESSKPLDSKTPPTVDSSSS